jgi:hypothetical protein
VEDTGAIAALAMLEQYLSCFLSYSAKHLMIEKKDGRNQLPSSSN